MTGFEPQTSGVGNARHANWATTTALQILNFLKDLCKVHDWQHGISDIIIIFMATFVLEK